MTTSSQSESSTLLPISNCWGEFKVFQPGSVGDDWNLCIHPQGCVYFYNPSLRVVVDHDIRKPGMLDLTNAYLAKMSLIKLPESLEIHFHLPRQEFVNDNVLYLVINHSLCIASHKAEDVSEDKAYLLDPMRLNRCRRLYWNYLWNHPAHVPLPPRAIEEASDALMWFYTDNLTSGTKSVVPFSKDECNEMASILRDFSASTFDKSVAKAVFISWFLREVSSFRDAQSWGQHSSRESLDLREARNRSRRLGEAESMYHPSPVVLGLLNFVINVLFFGIPHTYRAHVKVCCQYHQRLSNMQQNWEKYIERLVRDYSHFLLISTVLLSATVGVLSLPEIPASAMTASMLSALASLGSIIVAVFFIWRHQGNSTTIDSFIYMHNAQRGLFGLYGHSLLLSLPAALLVWAVLAFSLSLILYVMKGVSHGGNSEVSAWIIFVVFTVLMVMIVLTLYSFSVIWKFRRRTSRLWDRLGTVWKKEGSIA